MHIGWQKFDLRGPGHLVVNINISLLYSYAAVCAKMLKEIEKTLGYVVIIFIIGGISIAREAGFLPPHPWLQLGRGKFKQASSWEISFVYCLQNFYWIYNRDLLSLKRFSLNFFPIFQKKFSN